MGVEFKHVLIIGQTQSGKSTKAKQICAHYFNQGRKCVVLDPILADDWQADIVTDDVEKFMHILQHESEGCAVFVDEGATSLGRLPVFDWLTTTGRHKLHTVHLIGHRPESFTPTIRMCCIELYAFNINYKSAQDLALDYNKPDLNGAVDLLQGDYLYTERMQAGVWSGNVFDEINGESSQIDTESYEPSQDDIGEYDANDDEEST